MKNKEHQEKGIRQPVRTDAPFLSEQEKIGRIAAAFVTIMETLGLDLEDDSLKGTPVRVAKMYVSELFKGLDPAAAPDISTFDNHYQYNRVLIEKNILVKSTCEHHFLPILGHAHVGYYSSGRIIGLSKLNRIVDYYCRRPQVQERLTRQILIALQEALQTQDVIVVIDAVHLCVTARGIEDPHCSTYTIDYGGCFEDPLVRKEFLDCCPSSKLPGLLQ